MSSSTSTTTQVTTPAPEATPLLPAAVPPVIPKSGEKLYGYLPWFGEELDHWDVEHTGKYHIQ